MIFLRARKRGWGFLWGMSVEKKIPWGEKKTLTGTERATTLLMTGGK